MQGKHFIFPLLIWMICSTAVQAQRAEIGVDAGGSGYMGDLNPINPLKISGISAGVFAKINFDPHWGLGLHYTHGGIKANDAKSTNAHFRDRNLNFKTNLNEIAIISEFNFIDIYSPVSKRKVSPFIYAGIGGVLFNPIGTYNGNYDYELKNYNTEGPKKAYRDYAIVVPYGVGIKYRWTDNLTLLSKIGYRTVFTDYLDDVSSIYPALEDWDDYGDVNRKDMSAFLSDPSGPIGSKKFNPGDQRGDFRKRDTYMFVSIGISYTFVSQKCFTF